GGGRVPKRSMAATSIKTAPLQIDHFGQFPAYSISFDLAPGVSLGEGVDAIRKAEREIALPRSIVTVFQGSALAFQNSLGNEIWLILAAVVTVYIVLG